MSSFCKLSICSFIAPYIVGSPSCNLTTSFSFLAFLFKISKISSLTSFAALKSLPFLQNFRIGYVIKEPEYTTMSAF